MSSPSPTGVLATKNYREFQILGDSGVLHTFQGAALASRALPGDRVSWDGARCQLLERRPAPLFLVGTLETAAKVRYGMTSRGIPLYRFTTMSPEYPPFFVGSSTKDTFTNHLVRIQFDSWPAESTCPKGVVVETYGAAGGLEAEELALLGHYGPVRYKRNPQLVEGLVAPAPPAAGEPVSAFHIDPPGCRDIDDALSVRTTPGGLELNIHIADVASWLLANPDLAGPAAAASQTLYQDGAAVRPMFPPALSEGLFSLLPGEERRAVTLTLAWDRAAASFQGEAKWSQQMIRVTESYTYESARECPAAVHLTAICAGLGVQDPGDPHSWVEQCMLLYNREAAARLAVAGKGVLRRHGEPDLERLARLQAIGLPAERLAMRAGEYCVADAEDTRHWGLGAAVYCHATSPIRRWADCLNQLCLLSLLGGVAAPTITALEIQGLQAGAKRAKAYERDLAFARILLRPSIPTAFPATVAEPGRVWIPALDRLVKAATRDLAPGTTGKVYIFCDAGQRNWKSRLVARMEAA